jgi:beta-glucosidase/6-phospho-beta-glucosidase/beta-galactosidase
MPDLTLGPTATDFIWAGGIEDTFVPQTRPGHRALDEYDLMGHYRHWREDLALARELGLKAIRWGVPWYRVEPQPGVFDWRWVDQVLPYIVEELGVIPIIDLIHYGCPLWLEREFANQRYPEAVAAYAAAFAERYRGLVRWYTPLNEPLVNALMCGQRGLWPPYLRGDSGYVRVMLQIVKGMICTVQTLRTVDPQAQIVYVEAAGLSRADSEDLQARVEEDQRRGYLSLDLVTGRVTPDHPLYTWLIHNGADPDELALITQQPVALDVLGLNFYPQWSTKHICLDSRGRIVYRTTDKTGSGFADLLTAYYRRYQLPIMITETSALGSERVRSRWLTASVAAVRRLRGQGIPVIGYTWFPMFTMIDWRYRHGKRPIEAYRIELGLYTLNDDGARRRPTPLVEQWRAYVANPFEAIGELVNV